MTKLLGLCPWAETAMTSGALALVCLLESDEEAGQTTGDQTPSLDISSQENKREKIVHPWKI